MDKLPKMDCKGRKLIFYCKSFLGNMFGGFMRSLWGHKLGRCGKFVGTQTWAMWEVCEETNLGDVGQLQRTSLLFINKNAQPMYINIPVGIWPNIPLP
jgi:hypothetical protein